MLGEAARIRAAGCALPSPSNRGLKWVKEEGGGPGGLGEGPEELRRHPEGGDQGRTPGKAKPCVQRALGARAEQCRGCGGLGGSRNHFRINSRGARPWLLPQSAGPSFSHSVTLGAQISLNPSASSRAPHPTRPQPRGLRGALSVSFTLWLRPRGGPSSAQLSSREVRAEEWGEEP